MHDRTETGCHLILLYNNADVHVDNTGDNIIDIVLYVSFQYVTVRGHL